MENSLNKKGYQERLVDIGRGFDKLIHKVELPKNSKKEIIITYRGDEKLDGVYSDNSNVIIRQVSELSGEVRVRAVVKAIDNRPINKSIIFYFDPETPFYIKDGVTVLPNTRKLKQGVQFQINAINDFDTYEYNFGEAEEGSTINFSFTYLGNEKIEGVKGTCGCTDVKIEGNKIFGTLSIKDLVGNVSKTVNVYFGDFARSYESINGILISNKDSKVTTLAIRGNSISRKP